MLQEHNAVQMALLETEKVLRVSVFGLEALATGTYQYPLVKSIVVIYFAFPSLFIRLSIRGIGYVSACETLFMISRL